jgi:hypothetical protein
MSSRYQEWLKHVFDHEVEVQRPAWHWEEGSPEFEASPVETTELIRQTFLCSGTDLLGYTDAQVNQGIWYLVSISCSDFMFALKSAAVPLSARLDAVRSIFNLYADCFAKRCAECLGHLSEEGSELNSACYMFWDICPLSYLEDCPDQVEMEDAVLSVLEQTLQIQHRACREGAFHGLSELFYSRPERVHRIIDQFLKSTTLDEKLLTYARSAREGNVL